MQNLNLQEILLRKREEGVYLRDGIKSQGYSGNSNEVLRQEKYQKMKQKYKQEEERLKTTEANEESKQLIGTSLLKSQHSPIVHSKKTDLFKHTSSNQEKNSANLSKKGTIIATQNMIAKQPPQNPGTPKQADKVFKKKDIKPSQKIHSTPVQQSKKGSQNTSLPQQDQQLIQVSKKPTAAPTNSVVQTQESPGNSQIIPNQ
mmetsp:Transcript_32620/g.31838  ORF Transcript_32620/g.31838 Transcript_32620/m.31838 type:complete len:202 (-) Transcript_32620:367-972(-)